MHAYAPIAGFSKIVTSRKWKHIWIHLGYYIYICKYRSRTHTHTPQERSFHATGGVAWKSFETIALHQLQRIAALLSIKQSTPHPWGHFEYYRCFHEVFYGIMCWLSRSIYGVFVFVIGYMHAILQMALMRPYHSIPFYTPLLSISTIVRLHTFLNQLIATLKTRCDLSHARKGLARWHETSLSFML